MIGAPIGHAIGAPLSLGPAPTPAAKITRLGLSAFSRPDQSFEAKAPTAAAPFVPADKITRLGLSGFSRPDQTFEAKSSVTTITVTIAATDADADTASMVVYVPNPEITDTDQLQKPVDAVLEWTQERYRRRILTRDGQAEVTGSETTVKRSGVRSLGGKPTFRTKTDNKGYD